MRSAPSSSESRSLLRRLARPGVALPVVTGLAAVALATRLLLASGEPALPVGQYFDTDGTLVCDLGDLAPGARAETAVALPNRTDADLTVTNVRKDCSCLNVRLAGPTVPRRSTLEMGLTLAVPEQRGAYSHQVVVEYDGGAVQVVRFVGTVAGWVDLDPPALDFGEPCPGGTIRRTLVIRTAEPWPAESRKLELAMPDARIISEYASADCKSLDVVVEYTPKPDAAARPASGSLTVAWAGNDSRIYKVPCKGAVSPPWVVDRPTVYLGRVPPGAAPAFAVRVMRRCGERDADLSKYGVRSEPEGLLRLEPRFGADAIDIAGAVVAPAAGREPGVVQGAVVASDPGGREVARATGLLFQE